VDTNGARGKVGPAGAERYTGTTPGRGAALAGLSGQLLRPSTFPAAAGLGLSLKDRVQAAGLASTFRRELRRARPDLVHTSHAGIRSLAALWAAARERLPCVVTIYGSEFTSPALERYHPLARHVCAQADAVLAISRHTAAMAAAVGVKNEIRVVYPGIDPDVIAGTAVTDRFRRTYGIAPGRTLVLYAGWLIERKGPQVLLRALARLPRPLVDGIDVVFIGPDHGLGAGLRDTVAAEGWHTVRVIGEVAAADVAQVYRAASVLVFPTLTRDEGFGLVAVEAAAAGCAVLGSRIGAIPEVVDDGVNGALFEPGNDEQLAALLTAAVADPARLAAWRTASPNVARRFDRRRTAALTADVYARVLASRGR